MSTRDNIPYSRRAIIQDTNGKPQIVDVPVPSLVQGTVLLKTTAVALNPSDYKMGAAFPSPGSVIGFDLCGTVVAVADGNKTDLACGDVVCGLSNGSNPGSPESGAFANYVRAHEEQLIPLKSTDEGALERSVTLGLALATCTLSLWGTDTLDLPGTPESPAATGFPVLVYGGSTATGAIAIQLLRLSGFEPVATCSPHSFELVRACGADAVLDYADPDTPAAIKAYTKGRLKHALDCISDTQSVEICYTSISRVGGRYSSLELVPEELLAKRRAVQDSFIMAFELTGEGIQFPGRYGKPPNPAKRELGNRLFPIYRRLVNEGKLTAYPTRRLDNGLESIINGLAMLKAGSAAGKKLVVFL